MFDFPNPPRPFAAGPIDPGWLCRRCTLFHRRAVVMCRGTADTLADVRAVVRLRRAAARLRDPHGGAED